MSKATVVAAIAALCVFLHWAIVQPAPLPAKEISAAIFMSPLAELGGTPGAVTFWIRQVSIGIIALTSVIACGLSLVLIFRAEKTTANRKLAAALAFGSFAAALLMLMPLYAGYHDAIGWRWGPAWQWVLQFVGFSAGMFSALLMAQFFLAYPQAPTDKQLADHFQKMASENLRLARSGWRQRLYPAWMIPDAPAAQEGAAGAARSGFFHRLRHNQGAYDSQMKHLQICRSRWTTPGLLALAALCAAVDILAFTALPALGISAKSFSVVQIAAWFAGFIVLEFLILAMFQGLKYHRDNALPIDRTRIDWIYVTLFVGGLAVGAVGPVWWGLLLFTLRDLEAANIFIPGPILFIGPSFIGLQLLFLAFVISLALSIFYRGSVDPRLAARKVTLFGVLGILVAFVFILIERFVALEIVAWFKLPRETGLLIAGAAVAATFQPIRTRAEKWVNTFVARFLPLDSLVEGDRCVQAVVMADLSGYTALSARDEKQALLLAALLQRKAEKLCEEHDGRIVKTMGDAVMLAFDDVAAAGTVLGSLHREFTPAAEALGLTPLQVHSGAHVGEVTQTHDGDIYGQTVNIASRLQALAGPGESVVSEAFADAAAVPADRRIDKGPQPLRSVPEPVNAFGLITSGKAA